MNYSIIAAAGAALVLLNACDKRETIVQPTPPAVVTVPGKETVIKEKETVIQQAPPSVVTVPGPAGPPGAPGPEGPKGEPGKQGGGTVVIVPPPEKR